MDMQTGQLKLVAEYKYFRILELPQQGKRKTRDYVILTQRGHLLGFIKFYSGWRQHVLQPESGTVWSKGCLEDVNVFLATLKGETMTVTNSNPEQTP